MQILNYNFVNFIVVLQTLSGHQTQIDIIIYILYFYYKIANTKKVLINLTFILSSLDRNFT